MSEHPWRSMVRNLRDLSHSELPSQGPHRTGGGLPGRCLLARRSILGPRAIAGQRLRLRVGKLVRIARINQEVCTLNDLKITI
jgi:hypothetical protein